MFISVPQVEPELEPEPKSAGTGSEPVPKRFRPVRRTRFGTPVRRFHHPGSQFGSQQPATRPVSTGTPKERRSAQEQIARLEEAAPRGAGRGASPVEA